MATTKDSAPTRTPTTRTRGECSGCGTTAKALTAPRANVPHDYKGDMFCMSCNPRFVGAGLAASLLRMEA